MAGLPTAEEFFGPSTAAMNMDARDSLRLAAQTAPTGAGGSDKAAPESTGGAEPKIPTADEFFAPSEWESSYGSWKAGWAEVGRRAAKVVGVDLPPSSPMQDEIFTHSVYGRILKEFGQGIDAGWGEGRLGLSPETREMMAKAGFFNDFQKNEFNVIKAFNEAIIRPLAVAGDAAIRGVGATYMGAQGILYKGMEEIGLPTNLARDIVSMPDAFMGAPGTFYHGPGLEAPVNISKARELGIIGDGQGGWLGVKPRAEQKLAERQWVEAYQDWHETRAAEPPSATGPKPGEIIDGAQPTPPVPDIHAVARELAPDVFRQYDALQQRADTFRRWIDELQERRRETAFSEAPQSARIAELESKIPGANKKNAKKYQSELDELTAARDAYVEEKTRGDNPDVRRVREELQKTDYAMRDMAVDVSAAYRDAARTLPETSAVPEPVRVAETVPEAVPTVEAAPVARERAPVIPQEALPLERPAPTKPTMTRDQIASDVRKKLEAVGRLADEADAAAQIVAHHYEARAARLEGATAEELYRRDFPELRAGKERTVREPEMAQTKKEVMGKTRLFDDGRKVVTLMKKADPSTFMHETGHLWLEELMGDAQNSKAIEAVKADAKAVREWLGSEGDAITRAQHEKFARGFERYLMEGRAPNAALARVFHQFRMWLTDIYQTVTKLRAPITDDIRAVFDRLITVAREDPIIAEDRPTVPTFADVHESQVALATAEDAINVANRVRNEANEIARILLEDSDEFYGKYEPERPAGRGGNAPAEIPDRGDAAGPVPREDGGVAPAGEVNEGGNQFAPESPVKSAEVTSPNDTIRPAHSEFIDKAGNIRLDNLNASEDVNAVLKEFASQNEDFISARRGVVSDQEVIDFADSMGVQANEVNMERLRAISVADNLPLAARIVAGRKMLIQSAESVLEAMNGTDELAYAAARSRHLMIQETLSGITAEMGRGLRAFQMLGDDAKRAGNLSEFLIENTGRTLYQIREEMKLGRHLDTPQKVSKMMQESRSTKIQRGVVEYFISSWLSGPFTQLRNIAGNTGALVILVAERGIGGGIGALYRRATGSKEGIYAGEAKAMLYGILQSAPEAVSSAAKVFQDEGFTGHELRPGERKAPAIPSVRVALEPREVGSEAFKKRLAEIAENVASGQGLKGKAAEDFVKNLVTNPSDDLIAEARARHLEIGGRQIRLPLRALSATDEFFRTIADRAETQALAWREAARAGLVGDEFTSRVTQLTEKPTDAMIKEADATRRYITYRAPLGRMAGALRSFANSHPLVRLIIPFIDTPVNVIKFQFERTPLGLFSKTVRDNLSGKNGEAAAQMQGARLTMAGLVGVTSVGLALKGGITDGGPTDPNERAALRRTGWAPYSFRVGDGYYSLQWSPVGIIMGIYADMVRASDYVEKDQSEKLPALLSASVASNLMNQTWLQGPASLFRAIQEPDRYGESYVGRFVGSAVPNLVATWTREQDPYLREARTILDSVKARIPWASETLHVRRDVWGNPILRTIPAHEDFLEERLAQIGYFPGAADRTIRGVELTDDQYDDYVRISGRFMRMRLEALVQMPQFSMAPPAVARNMAAQIVNSSRESARTVIMMQNPVIIKTAMDAKLQQFQGAMPHKGAVKQPE